MTPNLSLHQDLKNRDACYFISDSVRSDDKQLLACIAVRNQAGFIETEEKLGKDIEIATMVIKKRNQQYYIDTAWAMKIICSTIALQMEIEEMVNPVLGGDK